MVRFVNFVVLLVQPIEVDGAAAATHDGKEGVQVRFFGRLGWWRLGRMMLNCACGGVDLALMVAAMVMIFTNGAGVIVM